MGVERARPTVRNAGPVLPVTIVASLFAGVVLGVYLHATGLMESVANLYGFHGSASGWVLHLGHSVVAGAGFALLATVVSPSGLASSVGLEAAPWVVLTGVALGVGFGVVVWVVAVAVGIPVWMDVVHGASRPFPYVHRPSLVGLAVFGATFAACFTVLLEHSSIDHGSDGSDGGPP
ncbi:hypothetical protein [Halovivax gelatinilyticus]|uniref:hypothetical protein n=1 Tax=Halovivax gelatinilyticus TaxID=2961597 RepID=UPI0020CA8B38|nr:hypothetical protein [Halovivax gelatinilyticus]